MHNQINMPIIIPPKNPATRPATAPSTTICLVPSLSQYYLNYSQDGTEVILIEYLGLNDYNIISEFRHSRRFSLYDLFFVKRFISRLKLVGTNHFNMIIRWLTKYQYQ
jgi:hypothetical protein